MALIFVLCYNRASKFSNLSAITLFFPESQGADSVQIFYVGFLGHWTQVRITPNRFAS
jgi:hypothetical protein